MFASVLAACFALALQSYAQAPARSSATASAPKPVIVELFTSGGCSDCPPAEALALQLEKRQPIASADVIVLEEHVDYWNSNGWRDPFSSVEWTTRQEGYVSKLGNGEPYTPEMVVDGSAEFVGSDARGAARAIENAASVRQTSVTIVPAKADPKGAEDFNIHVGKLEGAPAGDSAEIWLAVTEDGLHSSVGAGENRGRVLYHAAVVRSLKRIGTARADSDAAFNGTARVEINSTWNRNGLRAVVFVQDKKNLRIIGASSVKLADRRVPRETQPRETHRQRVSQQTR